MTRIQTQILELYEKLTPDEQRELVQRLALRAPADDFYEQMTPAQKAELAAAIAEADRGEMITSQELEKAMEAKVKTSKDELAKRRSKLAEGFDALTVLDNRSADEIIGYGEYGLPK